MSANPWLTQMIGLSAVEAGSKANPVISRGPPLASCSEVKTVAVPQRAVGVDREPEDLAVARCRRRASCCPAP